MTRYKTVQELAPTTIARYRSDLRRLWLSLPGLDEDDARVAKQRIAKLEAQLGVNAGDVPGPGRPRVYR